MEREDFEIEIIKVQEATQKMIAGYDHQNKGNVDTAIQLYKSAIEAYPKVFNGYTSLGYAYLQKQNTAEALLAFNEAAKMNPDKIPSYNDLAIVYARLNNKEQCLKNIKIMAQIDSDSIRFLLEENTILSVVDEQMIREIYDGNIYQT